MDRHGIAEVLKEIGVLMELKGENAFKIRAYQSGARMLESLEEDLFAVIADDRLTSLPGIGKTLAEKIETLHATGELTFYDELKASVPDGLMEMLEIPGLGAKKIKAVHTALGVDSIAGLEQACRQGSVAKLAGFGVKSQERIIAGIRNREAYGKRHLWWDAFAVAEPILKELRRLPQVERAEHAGTLRRGLETVGDLDFIVASSQSKPIMDWFTSQPDVREITARGETKSSVRFTSGLQADLRVVPLAQFFFALHHFTGSKDHNVKMRQRALQRGFSLSEWGINARGGSEGGSDGEGKGESGETARGIDSEDALFAFMGLSLIPPELREDLGEIEAAEVGKIPRLVQAEDIRGVFHNHTSASDGRNTLAEMARAAEGKGWDYIGFADHSKASFQANGLDESRILRQLDQIGELNRSGDFKVHLFAGIECDILPDGALDVDDEVLQQLDYVVASVHSSFSQEENVMTARIIRALEHPQTTMLGHLSGRILLRREGYRVDAAKIIDAAAANGKAIEINAHPSRLDMDWRHWRKALERGVLCSINPDAHSVEGLEYVPAGVQVARKGWLTAADVINTRSLAEVRILLEK